MNYDDPKRYLKVVAILAGVILYIAFIAVIGAIGNGAL